MRKLALLLLAACGASQTPVPPVDSCAAPLAFQWGTPGDDEAFALIPARSGGLFVAGYSGGTLGVSNLGPIGNTHGFVRKLSPSGATGWEAVLDTAETDIVEGLVEGLDGRVHLTGRTTGRFPGATQAGQFDAFTARLSAAGTLEAVRQFGDERPQHPRRIALLGGRLLLAGWDDVFVPTNYVADVENWFAAELSADELGQTWWVPARTPYGDSASAVAVGADGGAFVAGANHGGAQPGLWVRRLDALGQQIWGSRLTASGIDFSGALAFASNGTLLVAGTRMAGGSQPIVFALDPGTGAPLWNASAPRDLNGTAVTDMAIDAVGNILVTGSTPTAVAPGFINQGGSDAYVLRFDGSGKLTGSWQGGSAAEDEATGIALDSCGRIVIAGWSDGAMAGASAGRRDAFLLSVELHGE